VKKCSFFLSGNARDNLTLRTPPRVLKKNIENSLVYNLFERIFNWPLLKLFDFLTCCHRFAEMASFYPLRHSVLCWCYLLQLLHRSVLTDILN
jgi:hypothetical protein